MKDYKNRKLQNNYKQNGRMRMQNTLSRFKNQFSDRKFFSKSGKKFQRQHQNNAARVCNRLRVLTQNQVGVSNWFLNSDFWLAMRAANQRSFETQISKFQHNELLQECMKMVELYFPNVLNLFVSEINWFQNCRVNLWIFGYLPFSCKSADYFHWFKLV